MIGQYKGSMALRHQSALLLGISKAPAGPSPSLCPLARGDLNGLMLCL